MTGDASRVTDKPADMVPSTLAGFASAGVLWRGSETRAFDADRPAVPRGGRASTGIRGPDAAERPMTHSR